MRTPDGAPREWRPQAGRDPHLRGCSNREVGGPLALIQEVPPKASQQPAIHRAVLTEPRPATTHPNPPRPSHAPVPTPPSAGGRGPAAAWDVCGPGSLPVLSKSSSSSKASLDAPRPAASPRMPTESDRPLLSPLPYRGSGAFRGSPCPASY